MARIFVVDNRNIPDPDPTKTVEEIRSSWLTFFPELVNADVSEKREGSDLIVTFRKRTGSKGG
ncbi:MAG: PRTRC system protein C [bacterium]|nr:PRTRC system protein C [bacterium]